MEKSDKPDQLFQTEQFADFGPRMPISEEGRRLMTQALDELRLRAEEDVPAPLSNTMGC